MGYAHLSKYCPDCQRTKPVDEFYKAGRRRDGYCKPCRRVRDAARASQKAARPYDPAKRRDYKLKQLYGISASDYDRMLVEQGSACAICGAPEKRSAYGERPKLVVDHNHDTGRVRALLCAACNGALAAIENEQFMLLAKDYLRRHDGVDFVGDLQPLTAPYIKAAQDVQQWIREKAEAPKGAP